jgi:hypothetical protein
MAGKQRVVKNQKSNLLGEIVSIGGSVTGQSSPRWLSFAVIGQSVRLLWVIVMLRKDQEQTSENMGQEYGGNEWGSGQIVFIILFIPVAVEVAYWWRFGPVDGNGD